MSVTNLTTHPAVRLTMVAAAASILAVLPLLDLTQTANWLAPATLAIILVAAAGHMCRRLRAPAAVTVAVQLVLLTWWIGLLAAGDLAWLGIFPSTEWPRRLDAVFRAGAEAISVLAAPVPVPTSILVYLVGGTGLVAVLVDLTVAGLRRAAAAGVPLAACYGVVAAIEGGGLPWWWFVLPAIGFLLVILAENRIRVSAWGRSVGATASRSGLPATDVLARHGRRVGAVAIATAVAIPALAPALTNGLVPGTGGGGGGGGDGRTIRTDNPILDLQRNLTRPENVDVLRYTATDETPHYIRTVTLDSFDGEVWQTSDRPVPEDQRVHDGLPDPPGLDLDDVDEVGFRFEITDNYSSRWLPLAYPAQRIDIEGDWRYDTNTLDVVSTDDDILGTEYTATSLDVPFDTEALRSAGEPDSEVEDLTELPDELPDIVVHYAEEVTADAEDDFGRAVALQEWFRSSEFVYDLQTEPGTSSSALADFLEDRRGYCEQFAATMAIMARYLGIPARVAVGFTPGMFEGDGTWLVRAHDAHAWPELYFEGVGWVRWEPTPAARTGTAPSWTVEPREAPEASDDVQSVNPTTTPEPDDPAAIPDEQLSGGGGSTMTEQTPVWPGILAAGVASVALLSLLPRGLAAALRWRRWRKAGDDSAAITHAAWADVRDAAKDGGTDWPAAATPRTLGRAMSAGRVLPEPERRFLDELVAAVERARYAPPGAGLEHAATPAQTRQLCRALRKSASRGRRMRAFLWPTTLTEEFRQVSAGVSQRVDRWQMDRSAAQERRAH